MATVEDRVVQLEFENRNFTAAAQSALAMLDRLKNAVNFGTSKKNGLDEVQDSANKFSMGNVSGQVDKSASHFNAWKTAGLIAFATVVHQAVLAGEKVVSAFTIDPIKAGLQNYTTQINAVQTILANTQGSGTTLQTVNKYLKELNDYANQTVFNFSDMAKNIGTFTAAGVNLKDSVSSIKGISNLAALSGSSADQASTAMYQLSQAIAAGSVKLQDWNSVVNAGLGGKVFQNALIKTAKAHGIAVDQMIKKDGSFRESLQEGWITSKVLTDTLSQFTGDLSAAQLKAMGFTDQEAQSILKLGKTAVGAATKIKTLPQLTDALKEEVASAWANVFKVIFGDINQATDLFTKIHTVAENALTSPINHLADLLEGASKLGARTKVIDGFTQAFHALGLIVGAVKGAFRDIFPPKTAKDIADFATRFDNLMKMLVPSKATLEGIKTVFKGVFAALDIGKQVIKGVFTIFGSLLAQFSGVGSGFFKLIKPVSDWVVALDQSLKKGDALEIWFNKAAFWLSEPIVLLKAVASAIAAMFSGFHKKDAGDVSDSLGRVEQRLEPIKKALENISSGFSSFFKELGAEVKPALDGVIALFGALGQNIANAMKAGDFNHVLDVINTALLGGILLLVKKFLSGGINIDIGQGIFGKIGETFETLTGSMKAMQTQIKAKTLLLIASAIGILTASVVALSLINSAALTKALKAMAAGFAELLGSMAVLTKVSGAAGFVKLPVMAASLNLLATSILILAAAVKIMASMSWDELKKGLTGVSVLLAGISAATLIISKNSGSMISAGVGIAAIAVAMNILAGAVKLFSLMSWGDLIKGLSAVTLALVAIAGAMRIMPKGMVAQSAALVLIAAALNALYFAVNDFSKLDWKQLGRGLGGVALALVAIAAGMRVMPKGLTVQAAGLIVVAGALLLIQKAIVAMAGLSFGTLGKGLGSIAVALGVLAGAMFLMRGALPGATALVAVAGALAILLPVIDKLGNESWGSIAKGLGTTAAALALLVAAGYLAEGAALGLAALAVAAIALGTGVLLAGTGVAALAAGLGVLGDLGAKGIAVLIAAIQAIVVEIPSIAEAFAVGFINILKVIGTNGPAIVAAFGTILASIATAIINDAPKIADAVGVVLQAFLKFLTDNAPDVVAAGLALLTDLLSGIQNNIVQVTNQVATIITTFLNALAKKAPSIVAAGLNVLVGFLKGIQNNIVRVTNQVFSIITTFITAVGNNLSRVVTAGANAIIHFVTGLGRNATNIVNAGAAALGKFITGLGKQATNLVLAAGQAILTFLDGLDQAIKVYEPQIIEKCVQIGIDIIEGIVKGIGESAWKVGSSLVGAAKGALSKVAGVLHINSPSKLFAKEIGEPISEGIGFGVKNGQHFIDDNLEKVTKSALENIKSTINTIPDSINGVIDVRPTITPVLNLSDVQKGAAQLQSMMVVPPVNPAASAAQASAISQAQQEAQDAAVNPLASVTSLEFKQYNTSPEALSTVEVYRQTNNLLSQAKTALGVD